MTLNLFPENQDSTKNLLSGDGQVYYFGQIFSKSKSDTFYNRLLQEIPWQKDRVIIMGKTIETKRKVAWYADKPFPYRYSGTTKVALPWSALLLEVKNSIEYFSGERYNSCLLNLYNTGDEGMTYHSDSEQELKKNGAIASVSFGAERKFSFKHKVTKERIDIWLSHGSLLLMKGTTQQNWLHRLPPTKKVNLPRINLTFRQMNENAL